MRLRETEAVPMSRLCGESGTRSQGSRSLSYQFREDGAGGRGALVKVKEGIC